MPGGATTNNGGGLANQFGQTLQQGAQQARNLAGEIQQQILPPSGDQLFGASDATGRSVRNAIDNGQNQLQRGLQQGLQRGVTQVADRTGQNLRQAVDNVGQAAGDAVDQFGRALTGERSILGNDSRGQSLPTILPPEGRAQPDYNALSNKGQRIDQPIDSQQGVPSAQRFQPRSQQPPFNSPMGSNRSSSNRRRRQTLPTLPERGWQRRRLASWADLALRGNRLSVTRPTSQRGGADVALAARRRYV